MSAVIAAVGLRRRLGAGEGSVEAIRGIDLEIARGQLCAIIGPSGSGKSTLLYLLGALDRPSAGQVLIDGHDTSRLAPSELARVRCEKLGFIFQFHYLMTEFTALENVLMPMLKLGRPVREARAKATALLDELGLGTKLGRTPTRLSGGEQQRVAIARSLANDPLAVLADEPTGNLDTENRERVFATFERLARERGQTIVMVTHDNDLAARAARRIRIIDGKIAEDSATETSSQGPS